MGYTPVKPDFYHDVQLILSAVLDKMVFDKEEQYPEIIPKDEKLKLEGAQKFKNSVQTLLMDLNDIKLKELDGQDAAGFHARMATHKLIEKYRRPKRGQKK